MVWGAFSSLGTLELDFPTMRMNSEEYQQVLTNRLLPFLRRFRRLNLIYQQDHASIHASRSTSEWFKNNQVTVLDWAARSPDCNPMENLWGILVRRVYANNRQFNTKEELKTEILRCWANIEPNILQNLVDSMKNRIFELICKNGHVINY